MSSIRNNIRHTFGVASILITLVVTALVYMLCGRESFLASAKFASSIILSYDGLSAITCLLLAVTLSVLIHRLSKDLSLGGIPPAISVFLGFEGIHHIAALVRNFYPHLFEDFGVAHPELFTLFIISGGAAAIFPLITGPIAFQRISGGILDRKRSHDLIQHTAHHDHLTGLPTRVLLRDRLDVAIERAKRSCESLAFVIIDLDNFKRINDSLGHPAGDQLLCEIARRLKEAVRGSDTVVRMGGDEFVVLFPDLGYVEDARNLAHKLLNEISAPINLSGHELNITASIGVSTFPESQDVDSLFKNADLAMYKIKNRNRNGVEVYTPGLGIEGLRKLEMESALRTAMSDGAFSLVYQPQISFADNQLTGVEALLRWNSRTFGSVSPATFIPIAEDSGLIVPIGEWVMRNACIGIAELQAELGTQLSVAVNISPRQFQEKGFPETVEHALKVSGLRPEQLELEITEQLLMMDSDESLEIVKRVRKIGVRFAIDDFGTGFSNMAYITRFAVDRIKVDRSFVSKCDIDTNSRVVTSAIIALAHSLELEVIAEGVETTNHVLALKEMSCDSAQGYLYSRPLKMNDLKKFISRLPTVPKIVDGRSGIRLAFTNIGNEVVQEISN